MADDADLFETQDFFGRRVLAIRSSTGAITVEVLGPRGGLHAVIGMKKESAAKLRDWLAKGIVDERT